ncbi:hypothetical protein [Amycolatopsis cihanbeyliensis]|uniref:Uncharacterized protein n=1 Tax=Amycolatopsis cihanbeyliensis TaxID=1128664 RepID=A0A542DK11_AMYCI|nr:hypothetical protein [Amycolatopsis cihanbeyliensis]TQJ03441.1 hypothetical protein FB471_3201 [Amycolatopsis cihanbeyliensis]
MDKDDKRTGGRPLLLLIGIGVVLLLGFLAYRLLLVEVITSLSGR